MLVSACVTTYDVPWSSAGTMPEIVSGKLATKLLALVASWQVTCRGHTYNTGVKINE